MAKKKSKAKKVVEKEPKVGLGASAGREIIAIVLVTLAIFLLLALFGVAGMLGVWTLGAVQFMIGMSALLLPLALIIVAWILFKPDDFDLKRHNLFGLVGFFIFLSGIFQFVLAPDLVSIDQVGKYGGLIGYGLYLAMSPVLNRPIAVFILVAFLLISLVISANARLKELLEKFLSLFVKPKPKEDITINEPSFNINNKLPIKGTIGGGEPKPEPRDESALTVRNDTDWQYPPLDLLENTAQKADPGDVKANAGIIQKTLAEFDINVTMEGANIGPTVSQYTFKPDSNVKLSKINALDRNLALALAAHSIRIEAPIPGQSAVGVEVPNKKSATVRLRNILSSDEIKKKKSQLVFALGRDVSGDVILADLEEMPHVLIAGATKSGKSVAINTLITSMLFRNAPSELKLILVDPKRVELAKYDGIPHLLTPVISGLEVDKTISALKWSVSETEKRYKLLQESGVRNIEEYNGKKSNEPMPFIVIIIDELNDLMSQAGKEMEALIVRLAQMGRAAGIHLVLATQRPDVKVITGVIKANIPARIALRSTSQVDSRTILDKAGAEKLLGYGDMLYLSPEFSDPKRVQGVYLETEEVERITDWLRKAATPQYNEEVLAQQSHRAGTVGGGGGSGSDADEAMIAPAVEVILQRGRASTSDLQRRLGLGYSRAARLIDQLEERGIVGPPNGSKPREVLISSLSEISGEEQSD